VQVSIDGVSVTPDAAGADLFTLALRRGQTATLKRR
jgi:hypothetical protein